MPQHAPTHYIECVNWVLLIVPLQYRKFHDPNEYLEHALIHMPSTHGQCRNIQTHHRVRAHYPVGGQHYEVTVL